MILVFFFGGTFPEKNVKNAPQCSKRKKQVPCQGTGHLRSPPRLSGFLESMGISTNDVWTEKKAKNGKFFSNQLQPGVGPKKPRGEMYNPYIIRRML